MRGKSDFYTFMFALVICLVCSLLLSITAASLRNRQEQNAELDRRINILKALDVPITNDKGQRLPADELMRQFNEHIREQVIDADAGTIIPNKRIDEIGAADLLGLKQLPLYLWEENGRVTKYAFPISGKGLWSTIYGYLALESDLSTIAGITFYKSGETPGLGGEIERNWFQDQFKGKTITADGHLTHFDVLKGQVATLYPQGNPHAVDGISGATMTGKGVTVFLNKDLEAYNPYFSKLRSAGAGHGQ